MSYLSISFYLVNCSNTSLTPSLTSALGGRWCGYVLPPMHVSRQSLVCRLCNKALSLNNIPVFSLHAYRTRQMSANGGTKKVFYLKLSATRFVNLWKWFVINTALFMRYLSADNSLWNIIFLLCVFTCPT